MRICPTNIIQPAGFQAGVEGLWTPLLNYRIGTAGNDIDGRFMHDVLTARVGLEHDVSPSVTARLALKVSDAQVPSSLLGFETYETGPGGNPQGEPQYRGFMAGFGRSRGSERVWLDEETGERRYRAED